jgi:hypothetical protein
MSTTKQGRDQHGRFLPTTSPEEARIAELEASLLQTTDDVVTAHEQNRVLTNALSESRKISQEREKQLAEEKRLHNLSKMSDANARGLLQQIRDEIGGNQDEPALEKVRRMKDEVISRGVACEWNAAEGVRLAESLRDSQEAALALQQDLAASRESLRLAEQGRGKAQVDKHVAIEQYEAEFTRATTHMQARAKAEQERDALQARVEELSLENTRLEALIMPDEAPLLPAWARFAFAGIGLFLIAYWSHRMGFDAAMTLQGGAR